jgi:hypothetical protein
MANLRQPNNAAAVPAAPAASNQAENGESSWQRVEDSEFDDDIVLRLYTATFAIVDGSSAPPKRNGKTQRQYREGEREQVATTRKRGACPRHRRSKKKVCVRCMSSISHLANPIAKLIAFQCLHETIPVTTDKHHDMPEVEAQLASDTLVRASTSFNTPLDHTIPQSYELFVTGCKKLSDSQSSDDYTNVAKEVIANVDHKFDEDEMKDDPSKKRADTKRPSQAEDISLYYSYPTTVVLDEGLDRKPKFSPRSQRARKDRKSSKTPFPGMNEPFSIGVNGKNRRRPHRHLCSRRPSRLHLYAVRTCLHRR